jgi:hypothetical protein
LEETTTGQVDIFELTSPRPTVDNGSPKPKENKVRMGSPSRNSLLTKKMTSSIFAENPVH